MTENIFILAPNDITHGHCFKIVHDLFISLDCRQRSFSLRVASPWNSLPDDVVALEILGSFKMAIRCYQNEKLFHFVYFALLRYFVLYLLVYFIVFLFEYYTTCVLLFLSSVIFVIFKFTFFSINFLFALFTYFLFVL